MPGTQLKTLGLTQEQMNFLESAGNFNGDSWTDDFYSNADEEDGFRNSGNSPLACAIRGDKLDIVTILCKAGTNRKKVGVCGRSAATVSILTNKQKMVQFFLDHYPEDFHNNSTVDGKKPLGHAYGIDIGLKARDFSVFDLICRHIFASQEYKNAKDKAQFLMRYIDDKPSQDERNRDVVMKSLFLAAGLEPPTESQLLEKRLVVVNLILDSNLSKSKENLPSKEPSLEVLFSDMGFTDSAALKVLPRDTEPRKTLSVTRN